MKPTPTTQGQLLLSRVESLNQSLMETIRTCGVLAPQPVAAAKEASHKPVSLLEMSHDGTAEDVEKYRLRLEDALKEEKNHYVTLQEVMQTELEEKEKEVAQSKKQLEETKKSLEDTTRLLSAAKEEAATSLATLKASLEHELEISKETCTDCP